MDDEERARRARLRLRAVLDGLDLDPDETADDRAIRESSAAPTEVDDQLRRDVPPHHGA